MLNSEKFVDYCDKKPSICNNKYENIAQLNTIGTIEIFAPIHSRYEKVPHNLLLKLKNRKIESSDLTHSW